MSRSDPPAVFSAQIDSLELVSSTCLEGKQIPVLVLHPVVDTTTFWTLKLDATVEWPEDIAATGSSQLRMTKRINPREVRNRLLYEACLEAKIRTHIASDRALVSIPIAPSELAQTDFLESVRKALVAADLSPRHIELAFSETNVVNASQQIKERLKELSRWGVELAVSGFGARYASLAYLEALEFATIKLATSFSQRLAAPLHRPHYPLAVIRGLLATADDLDITVVATGIKTSDEMRLFRSLGCSVQQGPLFSTGCVCITS